MFTDSDMHHDEYTSPSYICVRTMAACLDPPVTVMSCTVKVQTHTQNEGLTLGRHRGICLMSKLHSLSKPFLAHAFLLLSPALILLLSLLLFCTFGSNPYFWQCLTGSLVWRRVTGLAMQQSPVGHAHVQYSTHMQMHTVWVRTCSDNPPEWALSQTAKIRTAMLLFSILYFAPPSPNPSVCMYVYVCVHALSVCTNICACTDGCPYARWYICVSACVCVR